MPALKPGFVRQPSRKARAASPKPRKAIEPELIVDSAMPPSVRSTLSSRRMEVEAVDSGGRAGETGCAAALRRRPGRAWRVQSQRLRVEQCRLILELSAEQGAALRPSASLVERRGKTLDKAI